MTAAVHAKISVPEWPIVSESTAVRFKIAFEHSEFEQIFRLNYETFVVEIPQHPPNPERRLVDRFHPQNTYVIAVEGTRLVGMVAVRGERPFSLVEKLGHLDSYLPPSRKVCEIRLLAIVPGHRRGFIFRGLVQRVAEYARSLGYDLAVISGTLGQQKLYAHLGFVPFGPVVGTQEARFQPMYLTIEAFEKAAPEIVTQGCEEV